MSPRHVSMDVGAMCYDVCKTTRVEDAGQHANRVQVGARHREMSEQARARAHTERTSRYGKEPDHGEH
jgi:hypothetical protein